VKPEFVKTATATRWSRPCGAIENGFGTVVAVIVYRLARRLRCWQPCAKPVECVGNAWPGRVLPSPTDTFARAILRGIHGNRQENLEILIAGPAGGCRGGLHPNSAVCARKRGRSPVSMDGAIRAPTATLFDNRIASKVQAWQVPLLRFVQQC